MPSTQPAGRLVKDQEKSHARIKQPTGSKVFTVLAFKIDKIDVVPLGILLCIRKIVCAFISMTSPWIGQLL